MDFLKGILFGLTLAISFGPAYMTMMQVTLRRGLAGGFYVGTGILLTDIVLMIATFEGFSLLLKSLTHESFFVLFSGLILIVYGLYSIVKPNKVTVTQKSIENPISQKPFLLIIKGAIINLGNPLNAVFWAGLAGMALGTGTSTLLSRISLMGGIFLIATISTILKCYLALWISKKTSPRLVVRIQQLTGSVIMLAGIWIIFSALIASSN